MISERASQRAFLGVALLFFAANAAVTITWGASMSTMGEMQMPGGWTMSMLWMRMPGQTWLGAAASFLGMWAAMMAAMMLPSLLPMLWRYRQAVAMTDETHRTWVMALISLGYYFVWLLLGMAVFAVGVALAAVEMKVPALARTVPIGVSMVVLCAGALQFTQWKARQLACCRMAPMCCGPGHSGAAWRHGLRLGLRCSYCCAGLTAVLLVVGIMNLPAMALVTVATTLERLSPAPERAARAIGTLVLGAGLLLLARAGSG